MGSNPIGCTKLPLLNRVAVRDGMVTCPFWVREIEGSNPSVLIEYLVPLA